jgi:prepilin-type N-terminal cleavage/methylation domain-containing protein
MARPDMEAPRRRTYRGGMRTRSAYTLVELALVLMVLGILAGLVVRPLSRARDELVVRAARNEVAAAIAVTRATAISSGGATFILDTESGTGWIETAGGHRVSDGFAVAARYGVSVSSDRTPPLALRFDALGIGRLANAVIRVRRARAEATLTVSAYGRVRT